MVTFLRRAPRCMMEARMGALWPIEEIFLAVLGLLEEKGKIPPGLETPEEEEELPFSDALFQS